MKASALYTEVYKKILDAISSGEYPENSPLPAERVLCDKYYVSRSTLRAALTLLNKAEVVYTVPGAGTFVRPQVLKQPLMRFYSFTDTLKSNNVLIHNDIVSCELVRADQTLARKTGYAEGALFHKLVRLRSAQDYPLMMETTYLPQSRFVKLDLDTLAKGSLYEFLKTKYGFSPNDASEELRPVMPLPREKELLQIPSNVPCFLVERFTYEDSILSEYTKSIIRGDKYIFHVDLQ